MNKKMLALLNEINDKKDSVKSLVNEGRIDEAKVEKAELVKLQDKFDILKDMQDVENVQEPKGVKLVDRDPIHEFANAARHGFRNSVDYPEEGTDSRGGYTVPQDIRTKINKYKEDKFSLESLVRVESVSTSTGRRVFQNRSQHSGFSSVAEAGKIGQVAAPSFTVLDYAVTKYAGYLPVTNELLADSDANIASILIQWLGEESIATRNNIILSMLGTLDTVDLSNLDGIKKAVNVTLGSKFAGGIKVVTNDDGFNYLDTLKNGQGEYLLKPSLDPTKPMERRLAVGATTIPVTVVPNAILASTPASGNKATMPFYIGDLKEAITIFDRQKISITQSNVAAVTDFNAFEQDMTLFRGIERLDSKFIDSTAVVSGRITA